LLKYFEFLGGLTRKAFTGCPL